MESEPTPSQSSISEDQLIRYLLIGGGIVVAGGLATLILIIFVCVTLNFNVLEWMY